MKSQKQVFIPAKQCFLGYTVLKRYVVYEKQGDKTVVIYLAKVV